MRFFISANIKKNTPLYYAVLFFLVFALLFWLASWVHFYSKYGFSYESLVRYFFMDPDFPERVSIAQVSEDFHVGIFLHSIMLITLFSLLNLTVINLKLKLTLIVLTGFLALLYLSSDFLIIFTWTGLVWLKFLSFLAYQIAFFITWLLTTIYLLKDSIKPPQVNSLRVLSFIFGLFSLLFLSSNFLNFYSKMGFGVEGIKNYFLGNPELFIKGKSFEGVYKIFYPHLISMAIYSLILAHLLPFAGLKRKTSFLLTISVFFFSSLDNLSSLLLMYVSPYMAYVKLFSFWSFQITALYASAVMIIDSLKRRAYQSLYI